MTTIFSDIKNNLEFSDIDIVDAKLLSLSNYYIQFLINNGVPLSYITKESDTSDWTEISDKNCYYIVIDYITTSLLIDLNIETISSNTSRILESRLMNNLYHLKVKFDVK